MFLVHSNVGALYHQSTQRDNAKVKTDNFKYPLVDNKVYHFKDIIQYKDDNSWRRVYLFIYFSFTSRAYFEIDHGSNSFRPSSPI